MYFSHYRIEKFDQFTTPKHGYDNVNGDIDSPTSFDEIERPPLRHIDKYVRAELFGLSARYTVAFMAMMGFIISFGMKCNLSAAKSEREKTYNQTVHSHPVSKLLSYTKDRESSLGAELYSGFIKKISKTKIKRY